MPEREVGSILQMDRRMQFRQFDAGTFSATKAGWSKDATQGEAFAPEVEQLMCWAENHLTLHENEIAYGIFDADDPIAVGICELAITQPSTRGKWVKFIRLRLRPTIESLLFSNSPEGLTTAVEAYVASVIGVYHVKNEHEATIIKVYGRTQEQMRFLTLLSVALASRREATFETKIEGRWLVLNWGNL